MAGLVCGTFLFAASAAQQIGITINPSTAKAAFLTAMYVVMVPVFGLFLGRKGSAQLWVSMVIAVAGLYMLCMKSGFGGIETSDWILLSCAVLFSFQIMSIDHFSPLVDGVRLSLIQFIVVAVESSAAALKSSRRPRWQSTAQTFYLWSTAASCPAARAIRFRSWARKI